MYNAFINYTVYTHLEKWICDSFRVQTSVIVPTVLFLIVNRAKFRFAHINGILFGLRLALESCHCDHVAFNLGVMGNKFL